MSIKPTANLRLVDELRAEREVWEKRVRLSDCDEEAREYANAKIDDLSVAIGTFLQTTRKE